MRTLAPSERHTLSIIVDNESGVLARVIGLFSSRGYNIDSLTVAEVAENAHISRITVVTSGTPSIIEQIKSQLDRLVPVHSVVDLTTQGPHVARELALVKVAGTLAQRQEAMQLANVYRARVMDSTASSLAFELTGSNDKINAFISVMKGLGLVEVARTGLVAMARGTA